MPKEILKIDDFSGGINTYIAERDIEENQIVKGDNIDVSQAGILKSGGSARTKAMVDADGDGNTHTIDTEPAAGTGIFTYSHDYLSPKPVEKDYIQANNFDNTTFGDGAGAYFRLYATNGNEVVANTSSLTSGDGQDGSICTDGYSVQFNDDGSGTAYLVFPRNQFVNESYLKDNVYYILQYDIKDANLSNDGVSWKALSYTDGQTGSSPGNGDTDQSGFFAESRTLARHIGRHYYILKGHSDISNNGGLLFEFTSGEDGDYINVDNFYIRQATVPSHTEYKMIGDLGSGSNDFTVDMWANNTVYDGINHGQEWNNDSTDVDGNQLAITGKNVKPFFIASDGILRVVDTNFDNDNTPMWRGYIKRPLFNKDSASGSCMGEYPAFYNYSTIIAAPTEADSENHSFKNNANVDWGSDLPEELGMRINTALIEDFEMVAGASPNSSLNGTGDATYSSKGRYGGTAADHGQSQGYAVNDGVHTYGTAQYECGINTEDATDATTGHTDSDGYYIYPLHTADSSADGRNGGHGTAFIFDMGTRNYRINWADGDSINFQIRGFGNAAGAGWGTYFSGVGSATDSINVGVCLWPGGQDSDDDYLSGGDPCEWQADTMDNTESRGTMIHYIDLSASKSDDDWSNVQIGGDKFAEDGNWNTGTLFFGVENGSGPDVTKADDGSETNLRAELLGVGAGFRLIFNSEWQNGHVNGTDAACNGMKAHSADAGVGSGKHIGIRNVYINRGSAQTVSSSTKLGEFTFYYTWLYDDAKVESLPTKLNMTNKFDIFELSDCEFKISVRRNTATNRRITGARVYFQRDEEIPKYMLLDLDFNQGYKKPGDDVWQPFIVDNRLSKFSVSTATIPYHGDGGKDWKNSYITYRSNVGTTDNFINYRYKSAVVLNRRLYAGNIARISDAGVVEEIYGDRMVKSVVNQYDRFPENNYIDAVIQDGDEIVHLAAFADRILQFKRKSLYVINVSGDTEFLENQFDSYGVSNPSQVTTTELGVAWCNNMGLFLYDGQKVHNLLEARLNETDFISDETTSIPVIGYDAIAKKLIVSQNGKASGNGDGWAFCLKTFSFTRLINHFPNTDSDPMTNFIVTEDGGLEYAHNTKWYKYDDTPNNDLNNDGTNDKDFVVITKDYDFGDSGVLKKIHKIYVTYKMPTNNSKILITGAKNGSENFSDVTFNNVQNYDGTNGFLTATGWATAIIKPSSSLSCYSLQLKIEESDATVANLEDFEINDISIVYRRKTVK